MPFMCVCVMDLDNFMRDMLQILSRLSNIFIPPLLESLSSGRGGKQRSKLEVASHTNKNDPCGQTRKIITKMQVIRI